MKQGTLLDPNHTNAFAGYCETTAKCNVTSVRHDDLMHRNCDEEYRFLNSLTGVLLADLWQSV